MTQPDEMIKSDYPEPTTLVRNLGKALRDTCPKTQMHAPCKQCELLVGKMCGSGKVITWTCGRIKDKLGLRYAKNGKDFDITLTIEKISHMVPWTPPPKHCPYKVEVAVCMVKRPDWLPPLKTKRRKRHKLSSKKS